MATKHALVTGGAGFIGSHLCEHLLENGWTVTALDNFSTGRRENLSAFARRKEFRLVEGSAADRKLVEQSIVGVTHIFHLAAVVGVQNVVEDPVNTIETNHALTKTILHAAHQHGLRVLLTSSSEVYGANQNPSFRENDPCIIGPTQHRRWSYSASKLLDEFHAFAYFYKHRLPVTIVRLFNTIGPRQVGQYGMVVPRFIRQALQDKPITIFGTGEQKRAFTYVGDVVKALRLLGEMESGIGGIFNIGCEREVSIRELAETIKSLTNSNSELSFQSYREAYGENFEDVAHRKPDVSALGSAIGVKPETPLETALVEIIDSMKTGGNSPLSEDQYSS